MKFFQILFTILFASITLQVFATTPSIGLNFTSVSIVNSVAGTNGLPQNPTAGVGPTQYIVSTLQALRSFNKFNGQADGALNIDATTFAFTGGPLSVVDPWLLYDRFSERWFFSDLGTGTTSLEIVVSDSAVITPQTQWAFYTIPPETINPLGGGSNGSLDYQQPAVDQNAWYNGVSTFDSSGTFIGSSLTVIPKSSILAGSPKITVFPGRFPEIIGGKMVGYAIPALNFDTNPQYGYFLWVIYDPPNSNTGTSIQLYRICDAGSNPTLGPLVTIKNVPEFAWNGFFCPHKGNLFGAVGLLENELGRINPSPVIRNKQLYLCQDIQVDSSGKASTTGDRMGVRWYQFDMTGDMTGQGLGIETPCTVPVLIQSGTLFDTAKTNPTSYFTSSLMANNNGDVCISFSNSGNNAFINAGFAFRSASDTKGKLQTPVLVTDSTFPYNLDPNTSFPPSSFTLQRWGDLSVAIDPSDDTTFWLTQPWAALQNGWGIQTTQVIPK